MLSSLPPLYPHDAYNLWYSSPSSHSYQTSVNSNANHETNHARNHQQHRSLNPSHPTRTTLSILRADEHAIELRKANIRRFGAGWLRPPGVGKTLQGMWDEKAEREEQEANGLRELEALDAAQTRMLEEQATTGADNPDTAMLADDEDDAEEGERDLDDDIPDAEEGQEWIDEDGEDALPTEEGDGDYGEEEGMDVEGDMVERDLDEEIPEGGSYQHTDTDVEDESSDMEMAGEGRESLPVGGPVSSSGVLGSSVFGSSPIVYVQGERRSGGFGRGRGREN